MGDAWTPANIAAMVVAICTALGALSLKPAVDAIIRLGDWIHKARMEKLKELNRQKEAEDRRKERQRIMDEKANARGYEEVITRQDERITALETIAEQFREEGRRCQQDYAVLKYEAEQLKNKNEELCQRINELEERLANLNS